ncbi:hypothetical protein SAMN05216522_1035 [Rosenbergiella nectarea]|uniref:Uncharacterized protein n=1 Tax=Rosenbergiella nectarea TaxID=988801 RepID=A0A1H9FYU7_9GAMM|nr:hypothetical protein [Rosenbergiella nectarea]SEQ43056.1 hypothetical protein SAMN05216522_1035 [Rosenbergiella nectarea]
MMKKYSILGIDFDLEPINIFDELSTIDFSQGIESQVMVLDEALLQLSFKSGIIVDVGWYPAFEKNGEFIINRIANSCWEAPEDKYSVGWDKNKLISKIKKAIG